MHRHATHSSCAHNQTLCPIRWHSRRSWASSRKRSAGQRLAPSQRSRLPPTKPLPGEMCRTDVAPNMHFSAAGCGGGPALNLSTRCRYAGAPWQTSPTVLVLGGSGGTGTTGIQLAKALGAGMVITTTSSDNFEYCKGLGADKLIDYRTQNWWENEYIAVRDATAAQNCPPMYSLQLLRHARAWIAFAGWAGQLDRCRVRLRWAAGHWRQGDDQAQVWVRAGCWQSSCRFYRE